MLVVCLETRVVVVFDQLTQLVHKCSTLFPWPPARWASINTTTTNATNQPAHHYSPRSSAITSETEPSTSIHPLTKSIEAIDRRVVRLALPPPPPPPLPAPKNPIHIPIGTVVERAGILVCAPLKLPNKAHALMTTSWRRRRRRRRRVIVGDE